MNCKRFSENVCEKKYTDSAEKNKNMDIWKNYIENLIEKGYIVDENNE